MNISEAKYRIAYEAFSKFSASISKAETLDQLLDIVHKKSKYLFDSKLFRTVLYARNDINCFTFVPERGKREEYPKNLLPYEQKLLKDKIPFCDVPEENLFSEFINVGLLINPKLWGWHFEYNNFDVCVSILADENRRFSTSDIEILHLVVDTVITKYQELQFKIKLEHKNKNLKEALLLIEKKNAQIYRIVDNQQTVITERMKEISIKNDKLLEISKMNAHHVREPLSRIMGIVEIIDHLSTEELHNEALGYLRDSAKDLDCTLKQIIDMSSTEIDKFGIK